MAKRATLTDIADAARVSYATVDRVINNRPGVSERTRQRILDIATTMNYFSVIEGDGVRTDVTLDFILPGHTPFFEAMAKDLVEQMFLHPGLTVRIHHASRANPEEQARIIRKLAGKSRAIGIVGLDHPQVREALRLASVSGAKILTLVSDISQTNRVAHVGIDNRAAGRLAGHLAGRFHGPGPGKAAIFLGSLHYRGHEEREIGFRHVLSASFPNIEVSAHIESLENNALSYERTRTLLESTPDIGVIYNIGSGHAGIADAIEESGKARSITFIAHELTEVTRKYLVTGTLDVVLDQNPKLEAAEAVRCLLGAVLDIPTRLPTTIRIQAIFPENIPSQD